MSKQQYREARAKSRTARSQGKQNKKSKKVPETILDSLKMAANMVIMDRGSIIDGAAIVNGVGPCALKNFMTIKMKNWCDSFVKSPHPTDFLKNYKIFFFVLIIFYFL